MKNFNNFWEKIWFFLRENVTIFARKLNDFLRKILQLLQENLTGFRRFLHESLTVFAGTFDNFSGKLDDFCSKICWFLFPATSHVFYPNNSHPSKTRQILLQKSLNFLVKIAQFSWRTCQTFLQFPTIKFFCKNHQLSTQKLSKFYCQNLQIFLQNLSDFRIKNMKFNFLANIGKFLYKNCQILLQRLSAFPTKIVIFSRKKH